MHDNKFSGANLSIFTFFPLWIITCFGFQRLELLLCRGNVFWRSSFCLRKFCSYYLQERDGYGDKVTGRVNWEVMFAFLPYSGLRLPILNAIILANFVSDNMCFSKFFPFHSASKIKFQSRHKWFLQAHLLIAKSESCTVKKRGKIQLRLGNFKFTWMAHCVEDGPSIIPSPWHRLEGILFRDHSLHALFCSLFKGETSLLFSTIDSLSTKRKLQRKLKPNVT